MRQQLTHLQQYGIRPDKILAETLLPRLENNAWSLVWSGQGGFVRSGPSAGIVLDGGDSHTPPLALTLALDEARAAQNAPERLLLYHTQGASTAVWSARLNLSIEPRGAWAWQSAETSGAAALNLLQGEFAAPRKSQAWIKPLRPALWVLGLIVVVHLMASVADWARLRHEKNLLQNDLLASFKQTFPEARAIVDPALQMRRNLSELRRTRGVADNADLLPLLAVAAPVMRQGKILALHYAQDKLQFDLLLRDSAQLNTLREQLRSLPLHTELGAPGTDPAGIKIRVILGRGFASRQLAS